MTPRSAGSAVSANAGMPSVTRLIHNICVGRKGIGSPKKGAKKIISTSAELVVTA